MEKLKYDFNAENFFNIEDSLKKKLTTGYYYFSFEEIATFGISFIIMVSLTSLSKHSNSVLPIFIPIFLLYIILLFFKKRRILLLIKKKSYFYKALIGAIVGMITILYPPTLLILLLFILLIIILQYIKQKDIQSSINYSNYHKQYLNQLEEELSDNILKQFNERYSSYEEKMEHLEDLINLIHYKKGIKLSEKSIGFILKNNTNKKLMKAIEQAMDAQKDTSTESIVKVIFDSFPYTNFEDKEEYLYSTEGFYQYFDLKAIPYDPEEIRAKLISKYKKSKAQEFEAKLSRDANKKITLQDIKNLDGFEFENLIGNLYQNAGYQVTMTKKSGDQGADLIIEKAGISTAIQTKKYAGSVGNKAVQEIVAAMSFYNCDKAMVITTGTFTKSALELAKSNNVQLMDKYGLENFLDLVS